MSQTLTQDDDSDFVLRTVIAAPARKELVALAQLPRQDQAPAFCTGQRERWPRLGIPGRQFRPDANLTLDDPVGHILLS
jgi:hypothetical protein